VEDTAGVAEASDGVAWVAALVGVGVAEVGLVSGGTDCPARLA
jgi:hypothetical protein